MIITYGVGMPLGCSKMSHLLTELKYEGEELEYPIFINYLKAVRQLPIGSERLECSRQELRLYDLRLVTRLLEYVGGLRWEEERKCRELYESMQSH